MRRPPSGRRLFSRPAVRPQSGLYSSAGDCDKADDLGGIATLLADGVLDSLAV